MTEPCEATILWLMRLRKRELAEQLWSAREALAMASRRACDLAEENRQLRNDLGVERGRQGE